MDRIPAFRLTNQHLARRLPPGSLLQAAGDCPLQNAAPDAAALSLHARIHSFSPDEIKVAYQDRLLFQTHSLRGAIHLFPAADAPIFTRGLLPMDEEETRFLMRGAVPALEQVGLSALEVVDLTATAALDILNGTALSRDELGRAVGLRIGREYSGRQADAWNSPSPYAPGQFLGESIARFALVVVCLQGKICLIPGPGQGSRFMRVDFRFGTWLPEQPVEQAAPELARRFLHACGPSTPAGLAAWAGIHPKQATRIWQAVAPECVPVETGGQAAWLLRDDLPAFQSPPPPAGARFLPPHDPFLSVPDHVTIVPDRAWQQRIWRYVGNPGVLLLDGRFAGVWRGEKKGKSYFLSIEAPEPWSNTQTDLIEAEAQAFTTLKRCQSVILSTIISGANDTPG